MPAAGTCSTCGSFYCIRCVPEAATVQTAQCPRCRVSLAVREAHEKIESLFNKLWVAPLLMGMLAPFAFVILASSAWGPGRSFTLGLATGLLLFVVAILIPVTRSLKVAWICVVLDLLVLGLMILLKGLGGVTLVLALAPIWTAARIQKIEELQAFLRAQPAELTARPQG
jgi:O-antigen ligase